MRYGYWMPVFGGWLRNVPDEGMAATWDYAKRLTQNSEKWGYDLTLIAELNLNDIKGVEQPALDAWSTAAALAAVTESIELMVAVRPNFHHPALFAKQAANIDNIAGGRLALNVVSSWWADEAKLRPAVRPARRPLRPHQRMAEGGRRPVDRGALQLRGQVLQDWSRRDLLAQARQAAATVYAGGESEAAKTMIANPVRRLCHARRPGRGTSREDRRHEGPSRGRPAAADEFGMAAYAIVRDSEAEAKRELERITTVSELPAGFGKFRPVAVGHPAGARAEDPGIFGLQPRPAPQPGRHA
jgi:FMNH2-dependent dimethyl sulfone monooxygenase